MPSDRRIAERAAYAAYDLAGALAALLFAISAPVWLWRGRAAAVWQRLGFLPSAFHRLPARPVWIHGASVGETLAAGPLVAVLRQRLPNVPIVMSTTTLTGRRLAETELRADGVTLLPIDPLHIVDRAFRAVRPRCLLLLETEIWPGLLRAAHEAGASIAIVSGRISPRSLRRYRWLGTLFRSALAYVDRFGMQTAADAERIMALGAPAERVRVTGNLKAGGVVSNAHTKPPLGGMEGRSLLVAASTQPGEEEFVLAACAPLWPLYAGMLLLVAPRRPERFDAVENLLAQSGLRYERRSRMNGAVASATQAIVLDTVGELPGFLPQAAAVFVGGTIAPLGGHNVLEPARYAKPVTFGPHTENVADAAAELCRQGGAVVVHAPDELTEVWRRFLERPDEARTMGVRARAVAAARASTVEQTWELIAPLLGAAA